MERLIAEKLAYSKHNHKELNPVLFEEDGQLKSEIREKILEIVKEFLEYTQVDIRVIDIRLVGSNAAYNYHAHSDLDIHIITDLSEISDPEMIARLYFDSIKKQFKDSYDIKIKGIDVELYVEDINTSSISNGVYSVSQDKWVKYPSADLEDVPSEIMDAAESIEDDIIRSIRDCNTPEELQSLIDKIYLLRKDALATDGEIGAGNLAFKSLREKGILDRLKKMMKDITSKRLSLESKSIRESKYYLVTGTDVRGKFHGYILQASTELEALRKMKPKFRYTPRVSIVHQSNISSYEGNPDYEIL